MSKKSWVLTDARAGLWVDAISLSETQLELSGSTVTKRTLRGGLCDGVDVIRIDNGALVFDVLPTRGMGVWRGNYRGTPLGWQAPIIGPVHPKFVNLTERGGLGWLNGFDEWIVRCGLESNGAPGDDIVLDNTGTQSSVALTLHGRIANLPAHHVAVHSNWETGEIGVEGHVDEAALFGAGLSMRSMISTAPGSNRLKIVDEIQNRKSTPAELQLLYHCNFGQPLLGEGSRIIAPLREVAPRDARAAEGIDSLLSFAAPTPGYVEQVYFCELAEALGGRTLVALFNAEGTLAVVLSFYKASLPCFTLWKNTGALSDGYVVGLEPATNYPNPKRFERERGRVVRLHSGATYRTELIVEIMDEPEQIEALEQEITALQEQPASVHPEPIGSFSDVP